MGADQLAIRWALILPDGRMVRGRGPEAPAGMKLSTIAADAVAASFKHPAGPLIVVAGTANIVWCVQGVVGGGPEHTRRALGIQIPDGARVWVMPDGSMGIAHTVEALGAAYDLLARWRRGT